MDHLSCERESPPADFHGLKERIAKRAITFPQSLEKVAELVLVRPDFIPRFTHEGQNG